MEGITLLKERLTRFSGIFECHITVNILQNQIANFREACHRLGGSALVIELAQQRCAVQPMFAKIIKGTAQEALQEIEQLHFSLVQRFKTIRLKVEAGINNHGLPITDAQARLLPSTCYYEHHVRIRMPLESDLIGLKTKASIFDAHLSNNALRSSKHYQQRFLTQRFRNLGYSNAKLKLDDLVGFLVENAIEYDKIVREFNIFDSNTDLDTEWENG